MSSVFENNKNEQIEFHVITAGLKNESTNSLQKIADNCYIEQARFFIETRGHNILTGGRWVRVFQDDMPFREMKTLHGHAVRALYMACGITDLAVEDGDESLLALLETQWSHLVSRQVYITGGFGSRHDGEALGKSFELPNARAYTETCAAIGSMMWGHRLLAATGKARYADLIEWTLFNGMLPGWALDGQKYFYVNPLEDDGTHHRQPWYECSCCPPSVAHAGRTARLRVQYARRRNLGQSLPRLRRRDPARRPHRAHRATDAISVGRTCRTGDRQQRQLLR